jgi:hypothetical protein
MPTTGIQRAFTGARHDAVKYYRKLSSQPASTWNMLQRSELSGPQEESNEARARGRILQAGGGSSSFS